MKNTAISHEIGAANGLLTICKEKCPYESLPLRKKLGAIIVLIPACNCEYAHVRTWAPAFGARYYGIVLLIGTVYVYCS